MDSESSTAANPSQGRGVTWVIWFLVLVIIGYPLSPGPLVAFYRGDVPDSIGSLYAPLQYAADNIPAVQAFYDWYLPLWGGR